MSLLSWDLYAKYPKEIEQLFARRGLTVAINDMAFYPITVIGGVGLILNLISILVNEKLIRDFSSIALFKFLRVYLTNSAFMCLVLMFNFIGFSMRTFPWIITELAVKFYIHVFLIFTNIGYFYSTVLNILITLERILTLRLISTRLILVCSTSWATSS